MTDHRANPFPEVISDPFMAILEKWIERWSLSICPRSPKFPDMRRVYAYINGRLRVIREGYQPLIPATAPRPFTTVDEMGYLFAKLSEYQMFLVVSFFFIREKPCQGEEWTEVLEALYPELVKSVAAKKYLEDLRLTLQELQDTAIAKGLIWEMRYYGRGSRLQMRSGYPGKGLPSTTP